MTLLSLSDRDAPLFPALERLHYRNNAPFCCSLPTILRPAVFDALPSNKTTMSSLLQIRFFSLLILLISLLEYHLTEILMVYLFEPEELDWSSALLSPQYLLAMFFGFIEYSLTWYMFPNPKQIMCKLFFPLGIVLVVVGEYFRKAAWLTARASFTHRIKTYKRRQHTLVTHGVYSFCRHPGYLGWLVWAVGTQVLLANPVSTLVFFCVAWRFFKHRIPHEEYHLERMFPSYLAYRQRTPTRIYGIP